MPVQLGAQELRTASEASGFERYTAHAEMMDYLLRIRAMSTDMWLSEYGESREGRTLPYAIFSRPTVTQPWEAMLLGKPIVLLNGNVHGGERTLRESLLILIRELATRGTSENAYLDDLVILVAPQINPDGFHAQPRATRGNAWGIDLNRDYVKLEHPEIASYIGNVINRWHPHVVVDGHNGCAQPYNICYQAPSHAAVDAHITELADFGIFPFVDQQMAAAGFKTWYYQNGTTTRWNTGGFEARIGRNYGGFVNSIGILFESPSQSLETGVRSGLVAFKAVLEYTRRNRDQVLAIVSRARQETVGLGERAEGQVVVQQRYGPEDRRVTYEVPVGEGNQRRFVTVTSDSLMKKPIPTLTRPRPYAYLLPPDAVDAVAMLRRHNITVETLADPAQLSVSAYRIADLGYTEQYNHVAAVVVRVSDVMTLERSFPHGTYVVRTGQVLGRLVSHMLEPETEDNVVYWNTMDAWLPRPTSTQVQAAPSPGLDNQPGSQEGPPLVPIYKLMSPQPLATRIVP